MQLNQRIWHTDVDVVDIFSAIFFLYYRYEMCRFRIECLMRNGSYVFAMIIPNAVRQIVLVQAALMTDDVISRICIGGHCEWLVLIDDAV